MTKPIICFVFRLGSLLPEFHCAAEGQPWSPWRLARQSLPAAELASTHACLPHGQLLCCDWLLAREQRACRRWTSQLQQPSCAAGGGGRRRRQSVRLSHCRAGAAPTTPSARPTTKAAIATVAASTSSKSQGGDDRSSHRLAQLRDQLPPPQGHLTHACGVHFRSSRAMYQALTICSRHRKVCTHAHSCAHPPRVPACTHVSALLATLTLAFPETFPALLATLTLTFPGGINGVNRLDITMFWARDRGRTSLPRPPAA